MFKKIIFSVFLSIISFSSFSANDDLMSNDSICVKTAELANKFMEMRQNSNSITKTIETAKVLSAGNNDVYKLFRYLIIKAYEEPIIEDRLSSEMATREFSNKIVLDCLKEAEDQNKIDYYKSDQFPSEWQERKGHEKNNEDEIISQNNKETF